ncbi:MAG: hypothetical protein V1743_04765 [Nanoarchaeota archaeon]
MSSSLTDIAVENLTKSQVQKLKERGFARFYIQGALSKPLQTIVELSFTVGVAALAGEVLDHLPYIKTAIPDAVKGLTHSDYAYGHLDQIGAALGFLGYYLKKY